MRDAGQLHGTPTLWTVMSRNHGLPVELPVWLGALLRARLCDIVAHLGCRTNLSLFSYLTPHTRRVLGGGWLLLRDLDGRHCFISSRVIPLLSVMPLASSASTSAPPRTPTPILYHANRGSFLTCIRLSMSRRAAVLRPGISSSCNKYTVKCAVTA